MLFKICSWICLCFLIWTPDALHKNDEAVPILRLRDQGRVGVHTAEAEQKL